MKHPFLLITFYVLILTNIVLQLNAQSRIVAHRGYWQCEHSDENSLVALYKADDAKIYASEFDVIITKDSIPIVHHDDHIDGIQIEKSTFDQIRGKILKNGESVPTLEQYLLAGKQCQHTRLILEIKPHSSESTEDLVAMKVVEMVKKHELEDRVDYISFSLYLCKKLHQLAPKAEIAYLGGDIAPHEIAAIGLTGIDYHYNVFLQQPEWIQEAHALHLSVNVWTVNSPDLIRQMNKMGVDFITTNIPVEAMRLVK